MTAASSPVTIDPTALYGGGYPNVNTVPQVTCTPVLNYSANWCPLQRDGNYGDVGTGGGGVRTADWSVPNGQYLRLNQVVVGDTIWDNGYGSCNPCYFTLTLYGKNPSDSGYTQIIAQTYDSTVNRRWVFNFDMSTFRWQTLRVQFDAQLSWQIPGEVQLFG